MASVFTKIVNREIPAHIVAETDEFLAFLDINSLTKGHTLAIPKQEIDYLFDLPDNLYIGLQVFAREVAKAIHKTMDCERVGTAVVGLEVPHAHIHLVPIKSISDLDFSRPKLKLSDEELAGIAKTIKSAI